MVGANLHTANLCSTCFADALLWGANLRRTNLKDVNFKAADLSYTNIEGCKDLKSILFSRHTILKDVKADSDTWETNIPLRKQWETQNFLDTFRNNHKVSYSFWKILCNCGESISLWFFWSIILIVMFGFIYASNPSWTNMRENASFLTPYYFSVVTFVTLGYGDITPTCWQGEIIVILEVLFGYIVLGGLITIFAKKIVV